MTSLWDNVDTVSGLLELRAEQTPDAVAFRQEAGSGRWDPVNWRDFSRRVESMSRALSAAGLRKGDRLAIIAPVSLEWELLHHAALAMGVVVAGMDAHDLPERIALMSELADITAYATEDARVLAQVGGARLARVHFLLHLRPPGAGDAEIPAALRQLTWAQLEAIGAATAARPDPPAALDMATIIFTSGTTGAPKGIAYNHGQVCLAVSAICQAYGFVGHDGRLLCWLPLSNLFQRMVSLSGVRQGAATYLLRDPRRVMQVVAQVSPDIFVGVPRFYEKLYDGIRDNIAAQPLLQRKIAGWAWALGRRASWYVLKRRPMPPWLSLAHGMAERLVLRRIRNVMGVRLRCMVTGSAPTPRHLLEEFHALGWLVLEAYGLSENILPMAMNLIDNFRFGTVGRPVAGNVIVVTEEGTVKVRGPGLFDGYLSETGAALFDVDGFYRTGDLGTFDSDGYLALTGRSGDLIKTSTGRRVAPASIEAQLRRVPGVDQAVLIGSGRKCLVALCTYTGTGSPEIDRANLVNALVEHVALINEHERPLGVALIDRPFSLERGELTPNLKLRRAAIEGGYSSLIESLYQKLDQQAGTGTQQLVVA